uniref:Cytochrome b5 heme-binding domain-containing protein n=1 Tax=Globodera rostochiensis TaxID=31243 RepID=A0A914I0I8_GLORO
MQHFYSSLFFIAFAPLHILKINGQENAEMINPAVWSSSQHDLIVHLRANSYNITAFVPNHPGGPAVLQSVNGQDIEDYIEGRKCALGVCHHHRYAYQVLSQFEMPSDVIVGVNGKWYNITAFLPNHPGGPFVLKAVNGQQNVEEYLEGRKCVFGVCHRHSHAYEVLSQLEMSSINTAAQLPSPQPQQNSSNSSSVPYPLGRSKSNSQPQKFAPLAKQNVTERSNNSDSDKKETIELRNNRPEFGLSNNPSHHQKKVEKEEQIEKKLQRDKKFKQKSEGNVPKSKNVPADQKQAGIGNKKPNADIKKPTHSSIYANVTAQNATKSQQQKRSNDNKNVTNSDRQLAENGQTNGHDNRQKGTKTPQQLTKSNSPAAPDNHSAHRPLMRSPRGHRGGAGEGRRRRVPPPLCLFVKRSEQPPHDYKCA